MACRSTHFETVNYLGHNLKGKFHKMLLENSQDQRENYFLNLKIPRSEWDAI